MPCSGNVVVTYGVKGRSEFGPVAVTSEGEPSRAATVLNVSSKDLEFSMLGTIDELLDFASDLVHTIYSWMLTNGHSDWLEKLASETESEAAGDGGHG
jgi:hypothetical protein